MKMGELCNRDVVVVAPETSIAETASLMRQHHVGNVVVVRERNGERYPVGIVTDRDIVVEVLGQDVDQRRLTVKDIMTNELITANESDDIFQSIKRMRAKGVRRMPIIRSSGTLIGVVSVDDIIDLLSEQLKELSILISKEQKREKDTRS